jgi:hypothetical protein
MTNDEILQNLKRLDNIEENITEHEVEITRLRKIFNEIVDNIEVEMYCRGRNYYGDPLNDEQKQGLRNQGYEVGEATKENTPKREH